MKELLSDKEALNARIAENISRVEDLFKKYDSIQLMGSAGLYLLDNVANLEKHFMAKFEGKSMNLDEDSEALAEYTINFGLSLPNEGKETPSVDIVIELRETLRWLFYAYRLIDMPLEVDAEKDINWAIHSELIGVRGDGYMQHVQEVFKEMFFPHSSFFEKRYGFKVEELFEFFIDVEDRILCKIGSQDMVAEG